MDEISYYFQGLHPRKILIQLDYVFPILNFSNQTRDPL